jgi:hypothetical protein
MEVTGPGGEKIDSLEAWARLYESPRSAHQWKEYRSAYSVADFILNRNGGAAIQARVGQALGEPVELDRVIPEMEIRFDQYGRGRMHDLGIYGRTASGKSLFVGVEAKVDEPFGALAREAYLGAKARQIAGESTNAPERIELTSPWSGRLRAARFGAAQGRVRWHLTSRWSGRLRAARFGAAQRRVRCHGFEESNCT